MQAGGPRTVTSCWQRPTASLLSAIGRAVRRRGIPDRRSTPRPSWNWSHSGLAGTRTASGESGPWQARAGCDDMTSNHPQTAWRPICLVQILGVCLAADQNQNCAKGQTTEQATEPQFPQRPTFRPEPHARHCPSKRAGIRCRRPPNPEPGWVRVQARQKRGKPRDGDQTASVRIFHPA